MTIKSSEIEQKLISIIAEINDVDVSTLHSEMSIADTELDSLDAVNMLFEIEDHYGISLEDSDEINERMNLGTIAELAQRIGEELEKSTEDTSCPA